MPDREGPDLEGPGETDPTDPLALARDIADAYRAAGGIARPKRTRRPNRTPRRPTRDDPVSVADALGDLVRERGWDERLSVQRVFTDWPGLVGDDVAAHSTVETFADGVLFVRADSTLWARQLQLLAAGLVRRLNAELGQNTVLRVEIQGPKPPSWKRGPRSVRDGRGPRDTYG